MTPLISFADSFFSLLCLSLAHFLWQGTVIVLIAVVLGRMFGRYSSRAEYAMLCLGLLLLPIAFAGTLAWETLARRAAAIDLASQLVLPIAERSSSAGLPSTVPLVTGEVIQSAKLPGESASWEWHSWARPLGAVYLAGVFAMCLRLLIGLSGGRKLCREAAPVAEEWMLELLARQCRRIGLRSVPTMAFCRDVAVPTLIGIARPTILLPFSVATGLRPEELESILLHELAHIRRYDHLLILVQRLMEVVFFFHPAVWLLSRRVSVVREHCCDDAVLSLGARRLVYIESLLRIAELSLPSGFVESRGALGSVHAVDNPSRLRERITRLLGGSSRSRVRLKPSGLLLVGLLSVGSVATSFMLTTVAAPPETQSNESTLAKAPPTPTTADRPVSPATTKSAVDPECQALIDANARTLALIKSIELDYTLAWIEKPNEADREAHWSREGGRERIHSLAYYENPTTKARERIIQDRLIDGDSYKLLENWDPQQPQKITPTRRGKVRASVGPQTNVTDPGSIPGMLLFDVTPYPRRSLSELAKVSPKVNCKGKVQLDGRTLWLISLETPEETTPTTTKHFYDVYLDPAAGYMIRKVVVTTPKVILNDGRIIKNAHAHEVVEFKDCGEGIFVPTKVRNGALDSWATQGVVRSLKVNQPIAPQTFEMDFPKYVLVSYYPAIDGKIKWAIWGEGKPLREFFGAEGNLQELEEELRKDPKMAAELAP